MKEVNTLGLDLAKNSFQLHGADRSGHCLFNKKVSREKFFKEVSLMKKSKNFMVAMEACSGAHYIARRLMSLGIEARLISAQFVKPYVKNHKTDSKDAEAIAEASRRPNMKFVGIKTVEHQAIQAIHRVREEYIKRRTSVSNKIRGLLLERGIKIAKGIHNVRHSVPLILDDLENGLTFLFRELLSNLYSELLHCFEEVSKYDTHLKVIYNSNKDCQRIGQIRGIGVITATALVSSVGDISVFKNGREFSAWLGVVPKERSTGGRQVMLGITKRGDKNLRRHLVHGCRSVVLHARDERKTDKLSCWIRDKLKLKGINKTSVAVANKTGRVVYAVLSRQEDYRIMKAS